MFQAEGPAHDEVSGNLVKWQRDRRTEAGTSKGQRCREGHQQAFIISSSDWGDASDESDLTLHPGLVGKDWDIGGHRPVSSGLRQWGGTGLGGCINLLGLLSQIAQLGGLNNRN